MAKRIRKYLPLVPLVCTVSAVVICFPKRGFAQRIPEGGFPFNKNMNFLEEVIKNPTPENLAKAAEFLKKDKEARIEPKRGPSPYEEVGPVFFRNTGGQATGAPAITPKRMVLRVAQKSTSLMAGGVSTAAGFATTKEAKIALNTLGVILNVLALSATLGEDFVD